MGIVKVKNFASDPLGCPPSQLCCIRPEVHYNSVDPSNKHYLHKPKIDSNGWDHLLKQGVFMLVIMMSTGLSF